MKREAEIEASPEEGAVEPGGVEENAVEEQPVGASTTNLVEE